jgi:Protein of unknown function (DUF3500)
MKTLNRRQLMAGSAAGLGGTALTASMPHLRSSISAQTGGAETADLAASITTAAQAFVESLSDEQLPVASYAYDDPERLFWHWTTPIRVPRNGLRLGDMREVQHARALELLRASTSEIGYQKSLNIMSLQTDLGADPESFFVTVFGEPGGADPWSWRFEGHHLSLHYSIIGDQVIAYPFFLGAWPTIAGSGLVTMDREENAARELARSLTGVQQAAFFQTEALGTHVTQNEPSVTPLDPVGISVGELDETQQALVDEIIRTYLETQPEVISAPDYNRVIEDGLESINFGWAGSLEPFERHYYRLQGPSFLLEFDNSRNGATHIHSVWRNFEQDFALSS